MGVARSTYYAHRHPKRPEGTRKGGRPKPGYSWTTAGKRVPDEQVQEWLCDLIAGEEACYGCRKLTVVLRRRYGLIINHKKVYRLCRELRLLRSQRPKKPHHPRRLARNRLVTGPNQLWEVDVKYGYIAGEDRFFFVMPILDVYDRSVVEFHLGLTCQAEEAANALREAVRRRKPEWQKTKPVIRIDNGPQLISQLFEETCEQLGLEHERIPNTTPNKNAHIEAFNGIMEEECLARNEFQTFAEAYLQ